MTANAMESDWAFESGYHAGLAGDVAKLAAAKAVLARPISCTEAISVASWVEGYNAGAHERQGAEEAGT